MEGGITITYVYTVYRYVTYVQSTVHSSANLQKTFWHLYKVAQACTSLYKP